MVYPMEVGSADEDGSLIGPPDWLADLPGPGAPVFRRRGGSLVVEVAPDLDDGVQELDGLRRSTSALTRTGTGFEPDDAVIRALIADPLLFRTPTRPVGDLLAELGFERRGAWYGPAGEEWVTPGERYLENRAEELAEQWEFGRAASRRSPSYAARGRRRSIHCRSRRRPGRAASKALLHEPVSQAFAEFILHDAARGSPAVARFADQLLDQPESNRAPGHYLSAMNAERDRDLETAERHLAEATRIAPDYAAALVESRVLRGRSGRCGPGGLAAPACRGAAGRSGARLPGRPGVPPRPPTGRVGRNDPCPCGSGRRFKQCCMDGTRTTVEQRAGWLSQKLERFAVRPVRRRRVTGLFDIVEAMGAEVTDDLLPALVDAVAWEPDVLEEFIDTRGFLLPDDELRLLHDWRQVRLRSSTRSRTWIPDRPSRSTTRAPVTSS